MSKETAKRIRFGLETDNDLVLSTTRLPFSNKLGALLNIYNAEAAMAIPNIFSNVQTLPGVMVHDLIATIGRTNKSLNTYMGKLYARLIRKISGAKDIEKCDQFMYIEIGKSCVDMVNKLKTAYELAFIYKEYNLYWPKAMLYALGFDGDSIAENLEDFRAWTNRFIARLRSFNFPNIAYVKSGWDTGRTILVDTPDLPRAQAYVFNLRYVYTWDPISDPNGTKLVVQDTGGAGSNLTFTAIRSLFDGIVDTFAFDQDFIDISAWYDHLYEGNESGLLKFTDCTEKMEHVQISNDPEALTVAENIETLPYITSSKNLTFDIYQLNNTVNQNMAFDIDATGNTSKQRNITFVTPHVLNAHKTKVTDKDIARYNTFKYSYDVYTAGGSGNFPVSAVIFVHTTNDYCVADTKIIDYYNGSLRATDFKDWTATKFSNLNLVPTIMQFSHRPIEWNAYYSISSGQYSIVSGSAYIGYNLAHKLDNYIEEANSILYNYHSAVWFTNLEDK